MFHKWAAKSPQLAQQQTDVVSDATQHRMQRIAKRAIERIGPSLPSLSMCLMVDSIATQQTVDESIFLTAS